MPSSHGGPEDLRRQTDGDADGIPSMPETDSAAKIEVTVHPQEWVDTAGKAHERGRKQLVPAEERDPVRFTIPRSDGTDSTGQVYADESYEANRLRDHPEAPEWVTDWDGPYFVTLESE